VRPLILFPLALVAAPAFGQDVVPTDDASPVADEDDEEVIRQGNEILVVATRIHGQVDAPQPPIMVLDEADVASYGAASISELLDALSPQTGSGRGRGEGGPVILLNGQRISSFREMRDIPPEAIRRMEILPEEVALRFGYAANQRVVNFILKDQFASQTVAGEYNIPTRGGFADSELEGSIFRIAGKNRLNIAAKLSDTSMLTEAERGLIQPINNIPTVAGDPDPARFRSLIADSRDLTLNGTWATGIGQGAKATAISVNGAFTRSDSRSLSGLDTVLLTAPNGDTARRSIDDPLTRTSRTTKFETGLGINRALGAWNLTVTADASHTDTDTKVERRANTSTLVAAAAAGTLPITGALPALVDPGFDFANNKNLSINSLATVSGRPFRLPAGDASLTVKAGYSFNRSDSSDTRTTTGDQRFTRGDISGGVNLALPITSRREHVLGGIGDVSLNFSAGFDHLSDFGMLKDWSAGVTWAPTEKLGFQVSYLSNEAAPSLAQLGAPQIVTFNESVFDFTRGETVLVTTIAGGNPNLKRETQRDLKIGANWQLPISFFQNSNLIVEYFRNRSDDVTQGFPLLTPAIEAAFPGRVVRDASGRIVSIDRRAVTFDQMKSSRLRWGFNIGGTIGKPDPNARRGPMAGMGGPGGPGGPGGGPRMGGPGGGGGPRGPGGGFGRGPGGPGGDGRGRWNLSIYHTVRFSEDVIVAPGGPVLDLLNGDATSPGGVARHSLEMEGGVFHKGFGFRLNGKWTAPTDIAGTTNLRFGSTFDVGGRIFVNFDQQKSVVARMPFLKGARLAFEFSDIFDSRQKVTDASGVVPLTYQAGYRDPRGRVIGLDFRKMF